MKKIFLLLLFAVLSISTHAQFRLGTKFCLSDNKFLYLHTEEDVYTPVESFFVNGGVVANYKINRWFSLQSEFIYNPFHTAVTRDTYYMNIYNGNMIATTSTTKIQLQYLEIPLLAKFTIFGNYKVNLDILAGAFVGYRLSAKQHIDSNPFQDVTADYTRYNAGYSIGFGLSIMQQRMFFEMRGNRGLVDIDKTEATKVNTVQAMYTVGYYLFRGKKK